MSIPGSRKLNESPSTEQRIAELLAQMTLSEKIGQMCQLNAGDGYAPDYLGEGLRAGRIGSVLNVVDVNAVNELQRIAVEESRLGIPLIIGRDVIHGFKTVLPIPLGQAATWNPEIVKTGARVAALEPREVVGMRFNPLARSFRIAPPTDINYIALFQRES